jgi:hypothetical protein
MLTTEQRKTRPLPTLAKTEEVEALGSRFHRALEDIVLQAQAVEDAWEGEGIEPSTLPTHEQIGYLYLFAYYMQMRAGEIRDLADRLEGSLPVLHGITLDAPLLRAASRETAS